MRLKTVGVGHSGERVHQDHHARPLAVSGVSTVRPMTPVESEKGEPMTWSPGPPVEGLDDEVCLCRCGGSANKFFCDGSYKEIGFSHQL